MVHTSHSKVGALRNGDVSFEADFVDAVATDTQQGATSCVVPSGLVFAPQLGNHGVESEPARIARRCAAASAVRPIVQVVVDPIEVENAQAHVGARYRHLIGRRVIPAEPFVVGEEVGLTSKNVLGNDGAATGSAKAVVVKTGERCARKIVLESVRIEMVI